MRPRADESGAHVLIVSMQICSQRYFCKMDLSKEQVRNFCYQTEATFFLQQKPFGADGIME
jgi:hypothetical protein